MKFFVMLITVMCFAVFGFGCGDKDGDTATDTAAVDAGSDADVSSDAGAEE